MSDVLSAIRDAGWAVAVHNDYRINNTPHTFWLFTHPSGQWVKGEGRTDAEALAEAAESIRRVALPTNHLLTVLYACASDLERGTGMRNLLEDAARRICRLENQLGVANGRQTRAAPGTQEE